MYLRGAAHIVDRIDCTERERIREAYMHQWVVDNMPVTSISITESDKKNFGISIDNIHVAPLRSYII